MNEMINIKDFIIFETQLSLQKYDETELEFNEIWKNIKITVNLNTAATEQVTAVSEELTASSEEVSEIADNLNLLGIELLESVNKFNV